MANDLWEMQEPVTEYGVEDVPAWIEQDISGYAVAAIVRGGCASGAYMPAVTYHEAKATMNKHGDDILQYIQDAYGELPKPRDDESWAGMACFYVSRGVELWASQVSDQLETWDGGDDDDA